MEWEAAREHNRRALLHVLSMLFAAIGLVRGGSVSTLPRHVRCHAMRVLRAAEAAGRRLIVSKARGMIVAPPSVRAASDTKANSRPKGERKPGFPLFEPLKRFEQDRVRYAKGPGPRMWFFDGSDPDYSVPPEPTPDDPINAKQLCGRLNALQTVLEDLSKYARRLALWHARREVATVKVGRTGPLRPGWPPGYQKRPIHPVDEILQACFLIVRNQPEALDTG